MIKLVALGEEYENKKIALKMMRALLIEWDVKKMVMRESKDLQA